MTMHEFTVTWEIQVDAETHEEAAREARAILLDPDSTATVFEVHPMMPGVMSKTIDLSKLDGRPTG